MRRRNIFPIAAALLAAPLFAAGPALPGAVPPSGLPPAAAAAASRPQASSTVAVSSAVIPSDWKELTSDYGWHLRYPKDWDVYVYAENNMNPTPEEGKGVNFSGPRACYKDGRTCGLIRMALRIDEDEEEFVPPSDAPSRKFGGAMGYETGDGVWTFPYDDDVWTLKLSVSGAPKADAAQLHRTMDLMLSSLRFDVPWTPSDVSE